MFSDIWFSAAQQTPIDTEAPHGQALLGVAFHPGGAQPWLGLSQRDLLNQSLPLADLLGDGAQVLRERLLETADIESRFDRVESWLHARRRDRVLPGGLQWALDRLQQSQGQLGVEALAAALGCSRQTLSLWFNRYVGLSAKSLARLYRFNDALRLLRGVGPVPWVELAAHCGYYDQSHLIRDFRAFSGFAPGEFLRLAQPDQRSVVLG